MKSVNSYLNFNGQTEDAFTFYQSVFGGELEISRYKDMEDNMGASGDDLNLVANVTLPLTTNIKLFGSGSLEFMSQKLEAENNFKTPIYETVDCANRPKHKNIFRNFWNPFSGRTKLDIG